MNNNTIVIHSSTVSRVTLIECEVGFSLTHKEEYIETVSMYVYIQDFGMYLNIQVLDIKY